MRLIVASLVGIALLMVGLANVPCQADFASKPVSAVQFTVSPEVTAQLAEQVATKIADKLKIPTVKEISDEVVLQLVENQNKRVELTPLAPLAPPIVPAVNGPAVICDNGVCTPGSQCAKGGGNCRGAACATGQCGTCPNSGACSSGACGNGSGSGGGFFSRIFHPFGGHGLFGRRG